MIEALGKERSEWIKLQEEENRRLTETEKVTICVLHAIERTLRKVASSQETRSYCHKRPPQATAMAIATVGP